LDEANPDHTLWDAATGQHWALRSEPGDHIRDAAFTRDGSRVLLSRGSDQIELRDPASLQLVRTYSTHGTPIAYVAMDPEGRWVAGVGEESVGWLWDAASGREIRSFVTGNRPFSARISQDGQRILVVGHPPMVVDLGWGAAERALLARVEAAQTALAANASDAAALATLGEWCAFRHADDWAVALLEKARDAGAKIVA
jgi:hypothetical protein